MAESVGRPTVMTETPKCLLCGFTRCLDRAHLLPRRLVSNINGLNKLAKFNGKNVIFLCKNHHFLFDNNRLNDDEWKIIIKEFEPLVKEIDLLLNSNLKPKNKSAKNDLKRKVNIFNKWKTTFSEIFCKYGLFEKIK